MKYKILEVDDDLDNRTIVKEALEAYGYEVCLATNGLEAIEIALREKPNLILMDLSMPKLNGWQAVEKIRKIPEISNLPVIAFTANAMGGDAEKARNSGCNDYLSKPCVPKKIIEKVKQWL